MSGHTISNKLKQDESKGCWIVMEFICFLGFVFVVSLFGMHCYYLVTNWTSWESFKRSKIWYLKEHKGNKSPFDLGILRNLREVFFHSNYPMDWIIMGLNAEVETSQNTTEEMSMCI